MSQDILELAPPPADGRLAYGPGPFHFGDLRVPEGGGPHPVVLFIHGGFWRARYGLSYAGHLCAALAEVGVATWNIEYRRLGNPGGGWPGTFEDVGLAADHLRVLAADYPLDLNRVVAMGHSAGGHLALWLGTRPRLPADHPLAHPNPLPLRGIISLAGVVDLRLAYDLALSERVVAEFLGGSPGELPERYAIASPIERLPLGIPQRLLHGTEDGPVPFRLSQEYHTAAQAAGDSVALIPLPGAGHFELVDPRTPEWAQVQAAVLALLGASQ